MPTLLVLKSQWFVNRLGMVLAKEFPRRGNENITKCAAIACGTVVTCYEENLSMTTLTTMKTACSTPEPERTQTPALQSA
jgi:hypothetical protein